MAGQQTIPPPRKIKTYDYGPDEQGTPESEGPKVLKIPEEQYGFKNLTPFGYYDKPKEPPPPPAPTGRSHGAFVDSIYNKTADLWKKGNTGVVPPWATELIGRVAMPDDRWTQEMLDYKLDDKGQTLRNVGANLSSSMTSPIGAALMASGAGEAAALRAGMPAATIGLNLLGRAASVPYAYEGLKQTFDPNSTWVDRAMGAGQAGLAAFGVAHEPAHLNIPAERSILGRPPIDPKLTPTMEAYLRPEELRSKGLPTNPAAPAPGAVSTPNFFPGLLDKAKGALGYKIFDPPPPPPLPPPAPTERPMELPQGNPNFTNVPDWANEGRFGFNPPPEFTGKDTYPYNVVPDRFQPRETPERRMFENLVPERYKPENVVGRNITGLESPANRGLPVEFTRGARLENTAREAAQRNLEMGIRPSETAGVTPTTFEEKPAYEAKAAARDAELARIEADKATAKAAAAAKKKGGGVRRQAESFEVNPLQKSEDIRTFDYGEGEQPRSIEKMADIETSKKPLIVASTEEARDTLGLHPDASTSEIRAAASKAGYDTLQYKSPKGGISFYDDLEKTPTDIPKISRFIPPEVGKFKDIAPLEVPKTERTFGFKEELVKSTNRDERVPSRLKPGARYDPISNKVYDSQGRFVQLTPEERRNITQYNKLEKQKGAKGPDLARSGPSLDMPGGVVKKAPRETTNIESVEVPVSKESTARNWQEQLDALDSSNASDAKYRDILSTGSKDPLKRGETWRGRVLDYIERQGEIEKKPARRVAEPIEITPTPKEAIAPRENPTAKGWQKDLDILKANKSPDSVYAQVIPALKETPLNKGETYRSRVEAKIKALNDMYNRGNLRKSSKSQGMADVTETISSKEFMRRAKMGDIREEINKLAQRVNDNLKYTSSKDPEGRPFVIMDSASRYTGPELTKLLSTPEMVKLSHLISGTYDHIDHLVNTGGDLAPNFKKSGLLLDPSLLALHLTNPADRGVTMLMNPLAIMRRAEREILSRDTTRVRGLYGFDPGVSSSHPEAIPRFASALMTESMLHEYTHNMVGGHEGDFVKALGLVREGYGYKNIAKRRGEFLDIIQDKSNRGQYSKPVQELLQEYANVRRRPGTSADSIERLDTLEENYQSARTQKFSEASKDRGGRAPTPEETAGKVIDAIKQAEVLRTSQDVINRKTLAGKFKEVRKVRTRGEAGANMKLGKMSGENERVQVASIRDKLSDKEIRTLYNHIHDSGVLSTEDELKAFYGLKKLLGEHGSYVPDHSELKVLSKVFGDDFGRNIQELYSGIPIPGLKGFLGDAPLTNISNASKIMKSAFDLSMPFRQGGGLMSHPIIWAKSWRPMLKSLVSEKDFQALQDSIHSDPYYKLAKDSGLEITDLGEGLTNREEGFQTKVFKKATRPSGRAATAFMNKLRFDTFKALMKKNQDAGSHIPLTPEEELAIGDHSELKQAIRNHDNLKESINETNDEVSNHIESGDIAAFKKARKRLVGLSSKLDEIANKAREAQSTLDKYAEIAPDAEKKLAENTRIEKAIGTFLNNASGRGHIAESKGINDLANAFFFSPRFIASRLHMMNPVNYLKASNKGVRLEYAKSALAVATTGVIIHEFAKAMGAKTSTDEANTDFYKSILGHTRVDPWEGYQQYLVYLARMAENREVTIMGHEYELGDKFTDPTKLDLTQRFYENKAAAIPALTMAWMRGKSYSGKPFNLKAELINQYTPLLASDLYDLGLDSGFASKKMGLLAPAALGVGVQTYSRKPSFGEWASKEIENKTKKIPNPLDFSIRDAKRAIKTYDY